ncbi:hypothetical protein BX600DRAFT_507970 [Xylariales sp. PMI_506]|nr:hypothetical protein BX600DRAFT_507970 [Xylariales sp. PMI_506]
MSNSHTTTHNPFNHKSPAPSQDDWENWEDEDAPETSFPEGGLLINFEENPGTHVLAPTQKAKNAKAGIKLNTNVSRFRQVSRPQRRESRDHDRAGGSGVRFADAQALRALEGSPNSASIGSFSWLKKKPSNARSRSTKKHSTRPGSDLSPNERPIVIGIAVPSDELEGHQVSPQTAVLETPVGMFGYLQQFSSAQKNPPTTPQQQQQRSVWSPDTDASVSPYQARTASSVYSQPSMYGAPARDSNVPPVPALPATLKFMQTQGPSSADIEDDEVDTPCTLFEEDGSPAGARKSFKPRVSTVSPGSAESRSNGWWDHVTTPFTAETNPFKQPPQPTGGSSLAITQDTVKEWWKETDEKKRPVSPIQNTVIPTSYKQPKKAQSSDPNTSSSQGIPPQLRESQSEKVRILLEENEKQQQNEEPPPYSPPVNARPKYGVILPPSQIFLSSEPIPSPGPITPGLPGTMSSQGSIGLGEIPLTPRPVPAAVLPDRPTGTFVTQDQFRDALGTRNRVERQRRRHEKEEFVARKVGGFWRGRGIMSNNGCFGRTGREGRKRRRVCLVIFGALIAAIVLATVLAVSLTRKSNSQPQQTIWLNLTNYPPMPTGVLTIVGPDNSEAVQACLINNAKTLWSCAIPKDQQQVNATYSADQPEFIFQVQYDNSSDALWNKTDNSQGSAAYDEGFSPNPAPPSVAEMIFLGNTTDGIISSNKAGEPTPFYISLLSLTNDTVGPNMVTRRDESGVNSTISLTDNLAPPELNPDGTGAPARLYPLPKQQPVILFDRGLPTEHYGFYTYFTKTIYIANRTLGQGDPLDEDGGCLESEATSLVTWADTRFIVKIWTRMGNSTQLLGSGFTGSSLSANELAPGTMPYPVTITEDLHGGNLSTKAVYYYGVESDQYINTTDSKLILVNLRAGGTLINPLATADLSLGGIDGGTGGCSCEWVNFENVA